MTYDDIHSLVSERGSVYGTPSDNHALTACLWSTWLSRRHSHPLSLTPEDVCTLNVLQKLSRLAHTTHDDGWSDISGYAHNALLLTPPSATPHRQPRSKTPRGRADLRLRRTGLSSST